MIMVSVLYPNSDTSTFNFEYYLNVHLPLSVEKQGSLLKSAQVEFGLSGVPEGTRPPYIVMCHFIYDSPEAFLSAFLPHQKALTNDMKNYTDIVPVIQISEVKTMR